MAGSPVTVAQQFADRPLDRRVALVVGSPPAEPGFSGYLLQLQVGGGWGCVNRGRNGYELQSCVICDPIYELLFYANYQKYVYLSGRYFWQHCAVIIMDIVKYSTSGYNLIKICG